jgi:NAD+ kinase
MISAKAATAFANGKVIYIIGRHVGTKGSSHDDIDLCIRTLANGLLSLGYKVHADANTIDQFVLALTTLDSPKQADYAIIIGGDGTRVGAARDLSFVYGKEKPIRLIGINAGRLGFITDLPKTVDIEVIDNIIKGDHRLEERRMLSYMGDKALNDVVLRSNNGRVIDFSVFINGSYAYKCRADGVLVTTPTGSTAYATSANGAILHPTARVFEIVPLLPQTLSHRPLVVNDDSIIEVAVHRGEGNIYLDGVDCGSLELEQPYRITLAEEVALFCHPLSVHPYDFFATLREKLFWHIEPGTKL